MVNYKVKLENQRVEKWKQYYIDYKYLESLLRNGDPRVHSPRSQPLLEMTTTEFNTGFRGELDKVEDFFRKKFAEFQKSMEIQRKQTSNAQIITDVDIEDEKKAASGNLRTTESLKRSMLLFYRQIKYLQSFCILNYLGFTKILKKRSKVFLLIKGSIGSSFHVPENFEENQYYSVDSLEDKKRSRLSSSFEEKDSPDMKFGMRKRRQNNQLAMASIKRDGDKLKSELSLRDFVVTVQSNGDLTLLVAEAERLYADKFCSGDHVQAMAELLSKQGETFDWGPFHLGYRFGACLILLFWLLWDSIVDTIYRPPKSLDWIETILPIYRAYFCLVAMMWLLGCMMFVWKKYRVNYIYIFEFDPRTTPTLVQVYLQATNATMVVLTNFILYYKVLRGDFPEWLPAPYIPMLLVASTLVWSLFNRKHIYKAMCVVYEVIALLWLGGEVNFLTAFVADVFTSMVKVFVDIAYTLCVLFTGSWLSNADDLSRKRCAHNYWFKNVVVVLVTVLPLYFRLLQNIKLYRKYKRPYPFLANAMKYVVSLAVSLFSSLHGAVNDDDEGAYFGIYLTLTFMATVYSYVWDVYMDWGLGRPAHGGLRDRLMYGQRFVYYVAIVVDLFGRLMWIISLMPLEDYPIPLLPEILAPFLSAIELARRAMWGVFRLENEHLNNTGYRRIDGPVPDHFDTAMRKAPAAETKTLFQIIKELSIIVGLGGALIGFSIYFGLT